MSEEEDEVDEAEELPAVRTVVVPPTSAGLRLDRFLALRFKQRSRTEMAKGITAGRVTEPGGRVFRPSSVLRGGEELHLRLDEISPGTPAPPLPPILHEDEAVVVLNKPPGMMVHPAGTRWVWALIGLAKARWPERKVDLVHRLDKDTSGVLLLSKDPAANRDLKRDFRLDRPTKEYVAIVKGCPSWDELHIDAPIGRAERDIRVQMGVVPGGLPSRTSVAVIARKPEAGLSMVRCRLHTGRTHQIRVHLAHVGLPILGDMLYGVPSSVFLDARERGITDQTWEVTGAPRQALHAERIVFRHPLGHELDVRAPLPDDMMAWWEDPSALPWRRPTD